MEDKNKTKEQGWNPTTDLDVNLKTLLRSERSMKPGKEYSGFLKLDTSSEEFGIDDRHYTFVESTFPSTSERRNVHLYEGDHITCTKRLNGSLRLNFKSLKVDAAFKVDGYALEVANEIREALGSLVESK